MSGESRGGSTTTARESSCARELATNLIARRWAVLAGAVAATLFFGWRASELEWVTRPDDLAPSRHSFVRTHARYAGVLQGAGDVSILVEVDEGHLFTPERLAQLYAVTRALDSVRGVDHERVESIAHRTTRALAPSAGGALQFGALMPRPPRTEAEAVAIRRAVRRSEHLYGILVSRDEKAALVRAVLRPEVGDRARVLDDIDRRVVAAARDGWVGAITSEAYGGVLVEHVFDGGAAAEAGLRAGDVVTTLNGEPVHRSADIAEAAAAAGGAGVEIGFERGRESDTVTLVGAASAMRLSVSGHASLYRWLERSATRTCALLLAAALCTWAMLFLYFHEWRGALRPALTAGAAALWGLGACELVGLDLDPLAVFVPVFLTARAVVYAVQSQERYYEEASRSGVGKRDAVTSAYAASFGPLLAATLVDALCLLAMTLVPIAFVQKLAVIAVLWAAAIVVAELVLAPVVLDLLRAPQVDALERRSEGELQRVVTGLARAAVAPFGRLTTLAFWVAAALACANAWPAAEAFDGGARELLRAGSPHETARSRVESKLGAVDTFVVVVEGRDKNALNDARTLRVIERLQRELERDPAVAYSVSFVDVLRAANAALHDGEPRWGVLPHRSAEVATLFFTTFTAAPPGETTHIVSADYRTAPVTFYVRDRRPAAMRRLVARAEAFLEKNPADTVTFRLAGGTLGLEAAVDAGAVDAFVLANALGFATVFTVFLFVYRSFIASFVAIAPLVLANFVVTAMTRANEGAATSAACVVALGMGLGVQAAVFLIARIVDRYAALERKHAHDDDRLATAVFEAASAAGKPIAFAATAVVAACLFVSASDVRFAADAAASLAVWTGVAAVAVMTLIPAAVVTAQPAFVTRSARAAARGRAGSPPSLRDAAAAEPADHATDRGIAPAAARPNAGPGTRFARS